MKQNEVIHGYRIVSKPTNAGAGKCVWAFAEKDGEEFFVKEFLDPKRPRPESMGSPEAKRRIFAQCKEFERRHRSVIERIKPNDLHAGNLVLPLDFFYEGTRYYKVTKRLYPTSPAAAHELTPLQKRVLSGTLADSLRLLHRLDIVHGDLKPQNVLVHQPPDSDLYTAKLIDFDDAYVTGDPPDREIIGGDALYGAPEWLRYVRGDSEVGPHDLTTSVDLFAFGLMVHHYLTGTLPSFDSNRFGCPAEAVNAGCPLVMDDRLKPELARTLEALVSARPPDRPSIAEISAVLIPPRITRLRTNIQTTPAAASASRMAMAHPSGEPRSRVRINIDGRESGHDESE